MDDTKNLYFVWCYTSIVVLELINGFKARKAELGRLPMFLLLVRSGTMTGGAGAVVSVLLLPTNKCCDGGMRITLGTSALNSLGLGGFGLNGLIDGSAAATSLLSNIFTFGAKRPTAGLPCCC